MQGDTVLQKLIEAGRQAEREEIQAELAAADHDDGETDWREMKNEEVHEY